MDRLTMTLLRLGQATRAIGLEEAREVGLTPVQAQTLLFVKRTKSFATTVGMLARHLGATHASAVGVVDALETRGLLFRETPAHDRRVTLLRLTAAGKESCVRLQRWGHLLTEVLVTLSQEERDSLERGLGGVIWALRAAGHLDVAEPCRGCIFFDESAAPGTPEPHHCRLIERYITEEESLRDCPDHRPLDTVLPVVDAPDTAGV